MLRLRRRGDDEEEKGPEAGDGGQGGESGPESDVEEAEEQIEPGQVQWQDFEEEITINARGALQCYTASITRTMTRTSDFFSPFTFFKLFFPLDYLHDHILKETM